MKKNKKVISIFSILLVCIFLFQSLYTNAAKFAIEGSSNTASKEATSGGYVMPSPTVDNIPVGYRFTLATNMISSFPTFKTVSVYDRSVIKDCGSDFSFNNLYTGVDSKNIIQGKKPASSSNYELKLKKLESRPKAQTDKILKLPSVSDGDLSGAILDWGKKDKYKNAINAVNLIYKVNNIDKSINNFNKLGACGALLVEPIWAFKNSGRTCALTTTELAVFFGEAFGYNTTYKKNTANDGGQSLKYLSKKCGYQLPNALRSGKNTSDWFDKINKELMNKKIKNAYNPNKLLWQSGEKSATWTDDSNLVTPKDIISNGYGIGVIYNPENTTTIVEGTTKNVYIRYATKPINGSGITGSSTLDGYYTGTDNFGVSVIKRSSNNKYVQKRITIDTSENPGPQNEEIANGLNDFDNLLSAWEFSRIVRGAEWQSYKKNSSTFVSFNQYAEYSGAQILSYLGYDVKSIADNTVIYMYPNIVPTTVNVRYRIPTKNGFDHEYTNTSFKTNSSGYVTYASSGQEFVSSYSSITYSEYGLLDISSTGVIIPYHHYVSAGGGKYWYYNGTSIDQWQGFNGQTFLSDLLKNTTLYNKYKHEDVDVVVSATCVENTASIDLKLKDYDNLSSSDLPELYADTDKYIDGGYIRKVVDLDGNYKNEPYYGKNLKYNNTVSLQVLSDKNGNKGLFKDQKSFDGKGSYYVTDSGIEISQGNQDVSLTVEKILEKYNTSLKTNDNVNVTIEISLTKAYPIIIQFNAVRPAESIEYENPSFKVVKENNINFVYNQDGTKYTQVVSSNMSNYSIHSPNKFGFSSKGYYLKNTYSCLGVEVSSDTMDYLVELDLHKLKGEFDSEGNYVVTLDLNWEELSKNKYDLAIKDIKLINSNGKEDTNSFIYEGDTRYFEVDVSATTFGQKYQIASAKIGFSLKVTIGTDAGSVRTITVPNCSVYATDKNNGVYKIRFCTKSSINNSSSSDVDYTKEDYLLLIEELFSDGIDNNPYDDNGNVKDNSNCNRFFIDASVISDDYDGTSSSMDQNYLNNSAKKYLFYYPKMASVQAIIVNKADNYSDKILSSSLDNEGNVVDVYSGQYAIGGICVKANSAISTYYDIPYGDTFGVPKKLSPGYYIFPVNIGYTPLKGYLSYNDYAEDYSQGNIESALQLRMPVSLDASLAGQKYLTWGTSISENVPNKAAKSSYPATNAEYLTNSDESYCFNNDLFYYGVLTDANINLNKATRTEYHYLPVRQSEYTEAKVNVNKINLKTDIILEGKKKTTGNWETINSSNIEALDYSRFRVRNIFEATTGINYTNNQEWISGTIDKYFTKIATKISANISLDYNGIVTSQERDGEYFSSEDEYNTDFELVSKSAEAHCIIPSDAQMENKIKNTYYVYKKEYLSKEFRINPYNNSEIKLYSSVFLSNIDINDSSCVNKNSQTYTYNKKSQSFTSYENTMLQYETTDNATRIDNKVNKTIKINHKTLDIKAECNGSNVYRPGTDVITAFNTTNDTKFDYTGYYDDKGKSSATLTLKGKIPIGNDQYEVIEVEKPLSISSNGISLDWFEWHVPEDAEVGSSATLNVYLSESKIMGEPDEYKIGTVDVLIGATQKSNTPDTTFTQTKNKYYDTNKSFDIGNIPYTSDTQNDTSNVFFDNGSLSWSSQYWNHQYGEYQNVRYRLSFLTEKSNITNSLKGSSNTIKSGYGIYANYKVNFTLDVFTYDFESQEVKNINDITDSRVLYDNNFNWTTAYSHFTSEQNVMCFFPEFNYEANTVDLYEPVTDSGTKYEQYVSDTASDKLYSGKSGFNNKNRYDYINNCAYGTFATLIKNNDNSYGLPVNTSTLKKIHYTPIWYPDVEYKVKFVANEIWTPIGMLSIQSDSNSLYVRDSEANDWFFENQTYTK